MNPWVILSLRLSSGQLKIEAEDSGGHRFPAARPWVGFIPATALRGAGLNAQTKVLVPEVWPPQARVVYLRLPASIASRDWDPLIRIVLGHAASVARYVAPAVGGLRPFELPLRIVSMNQVRPYLNSFLRHNWVKETQRRGGLEVDDQVTFRWRDSAHNNEHKLMTLALDEFLRRFLLHLLPKGFVRIRHFGFLANRRRATLLPLCLQLLGAVPPSPTEPEASPVQEPSALWLCPKCGGRMVVIERLTAAQLQLRSPPFLVGAAA